MSEPTTAPPPGVELFADGLVPPEESCSQPRLTVVPVTLRAANVFVLEHHRHHVPVRGCLFCVGVQDDVGELRGVAIVGRPTSRMRQDGFTAEVTRLCTDGCPNACSAMYGAAWRAARAIGYRRMGTYILDTEDGTSLRAAGWRLVHATKGGSWDRTNRARVDKAPTTPKQLWEAVA